MFLFYVFSVFFRIRIRFVLGSVKNEGFVGWEIIHDTLGSHERDYSFVRLILLRSGGIDFQFYFLCWERKVL